jgi:hypothetical protein
MVIGLDPGIAGELMDRLVKAVNAGAFGAPVTAREPATAVDPQLSSLPAEHCPTISAT